MQTLRSVYVSTAEWRWVIVISGLLVALTMAPYAWALARNESATDWQFMGMLSNPKDGATYLAKMEQGRAGSWLFQLRHTPEKHEGAVFHMFYLFLGHAARVLGLSSLVTFHLARMVTSFFMYISLYQLGATIWVRQRPRRLFFVLAAVGSGLGWLVLFFDPDALAADLTIPEAFPLYASYTNPHFPMSIASLALIVSAYLVVFRRGYQDFRRSERDLRWAGTQLRSHRPDAVAHLRPVETPRYRLHERHRTLPRTTGPPHPGRRASESVVARPRPSGCHFCLHPLGTDACRTEAQGRGT